jgi:hypothetical protein
MERCVIYTSPAEACASLLRLSNAVHLALTADVILELRD